MRRNLSLSIRKNAKKYKKEKKLMEAKLMMEQDFFVEVPKDKLYSFNL
jgi:hypothetical protein